ncbi:MAG: sugar ABC transporter ATPase [Chitinophagaceae bacterium]|nr:sugar ABC transporter ATPase [Chitinophagaceae bacterium]
MKSKPSDCVLSQEQGYAVSEGARKVTKNSKYLPFDLHVNGLEIIVTRQVFDNGGNGIEELICPICKHDISSEDWDFLNDWTKDTRDNITCPLCNGSSEIHSYTFKPEWGFSNLGFSFWNWPEFQEGFLEEFRDRLASEINIVYRRV